MQTNKTDWQQLANNIKIWGPELGLQQVGICDTDLSVAEAQLNDWLDAGYHGEMDYMSRHGSLRTHPEELVPGTVRVIMARINYLPPNANINRTLRDKNKAYISRYATGGDYHRLIRKKMAALAKRIEQEAGPFTHRAFADSAPVMEKPLAIKAGLGWQGKNTLVMNREAGSYFFLGTLYTSLPLPVDDNPIKDECGSCTACMQICPTQAIVKPYVLNASRCISYLTIELKDSIPEEFRPLIGNRVYGCDDCQMCCPWNRFAKITDEQHFKPRHDLESSDILDLFNWSAEEFDKKTLGSPIRRIGYARWLRNMAVGLGNAPYHADTVSALEDKLAYDDPMVREHITWALTQQKSKCVNANAAAPITNK
jgi:epoxyqueuosine reductase